MKELLPFIIAGIASGAIGAGLVGTGLVLTYRTSGIINLAHGATATIAAYIFYWLHVDHGLDWVPAAAVAIAGTGIAVGLAMSWIGGRLVRRSSALKILGTVGIVLLVQGLATIRYGSAAIQIDQFLPHGRDRFTFFGAVVTWEKVIVTAVAVVATTLLYILLRITRTGLSMRAVVDDPDLVAMQAVDPVRVRRNAWLLGSLFASLSGVLILPFLGLDSIALTFLVVQGLGAAAIGRFASIPLTFLGGMLIGVGSSLSTKYVIDITWLRGFPASLPFLVLFIALLVTPKHKLKPPTALEERPRSQYRAPGSVRLFAGAVVLVPLALVPDLVGANLAFFTTALVTVIMLLSLGLLVRTSGQVSLCHAAFAAIGAVAFSQMHVEHGLPWILSLALAGFIAVPVGALVAIPAIRLSGVYLALATLGFGILVQRLLYGQSWMFTELMEGRRMPRPSFADTPESFYRVVLVVAVLVAVLVVIIQRSRLGRVLQGMSDAPRAMTALGLSTNVSKMVVFCISAYVAAIAGALLGVSRGFAVSNDPSYGSFWSLILLAMLAVAPFAEPWYALVPAIASVVPAYWDNKHANDWLNVAFGVTAVAVAMNGGHPQTPAAIRRALERFRRRNAPIDASAATPVIAPATGPEGIAVTDLSVRFGGVVAVDRLSFEAPLGRITGLVGPNGAGKTTTFDACSGLNRRFSGRVFLHGEDVTSLPPATRGRRGLGRTFQRMELADSLTVFQNVALGHEARLAGANPASQLAATPSQVEATTAAAVSALHACGIADLAEQRAGALSTGQRRLVELARVVAGGFDVLLLDEPSSGLDAVETARFGELLVGLVRDRGIGVLLVEHDIGLVTDVCDHVYLLDFGKLIFEGTAAEMTQSPVVRAAYLGAGDLDDMLDEAIVVAQP